MATGTANDTDVSRRIGLLEGQIGVLREQMNERFREVNERIREFTSRLDRLIFALFALGSAMTVALITILVKLFMEG